MIFFLWSKGKVNGDESGRHFKPHNLTEQAEPVVEGHEDDVFVHEETGPVQAGCAVAGQKSSAVYPDHDRKSPVQVRRVHVRVQAVLVSMYHVLGRSKEVIVLDAHVRFLCAVQNTVPRVGRHRRLNNKIAKLHWPKQRLRLINERWLHERYAKASPFARLKL